MHTEDNNKRHSVAILTTRSRILRKWRQISRQVGDKKFALKTEIAETWVRWIFNWISRAFPKWLVWIHSLYCILIILLGRLRDGHHQDVGYNRSIGCLEAPLLHKLLFTANKGKQRNWANKHENTITMRKYPPLMPWARSANHNSLAPPVKGCKTEAIFGNISFVSAGRTPYYEECSNLHNDEKKLDIIIRLIIANWTRWWWW